MISAGREFLLSFNNGNALLGFSNNPMYMCERHGEQPFTLTNTAASRKGDTQTILRLQLALRGVMPKNI